MALSNIKPLGKKVGIHTYWHKSLQENQPSEVQRVTTRAIQLCADLPDFTFNVFKLDRELKSVSLLNYPDFYDVPFPALFESWKVDLETGSINKRSYEGSSNRPILHRKELFISGDHPRQAEYIRLTNKAQELGLFENTRSIGFQKNWFALIESKGFYINGHNLLPSVASSVTASVASTLGPEVEVHRHKTALTRYALSKPMQTLAKFDFLEGEHTLFDYGCGKGSDVDILTKNDVTANGWDPHFCNDKPKLEADIVNLGFVINVIEDKYERIDAVLGAFRLCRQFMCASVMLGETSADRGRLYRDGVLTSRNTFQKYFSQDEFRAYLRHVLDEEPVAVGPGIFFVFKDKDAEQAFLAKRYRNRGAASRLISRIPKPTRAEKEKAFYEQHEALLNDLWLRWLELGRPPTPDECDQASAVLALFSTWRRALNFLERYQGDEALKLAFETRHEDLTVYFAMRRFDQARVYADLPESLKRDVKAFFGSLQKARQQGEALLFSVGDAKNIRKTCQSAAEQGFGYLDEEGSLTFHTSNVEALPSALRVYIGCATLVFGDVTSADLLKVHAESGKLSLMMYDDFENCALPKLLERIKINLSEQRFDYYKYGEQFIAPYLYLKSRFITDDYPHYAEQCEFDEALAALEGVSIEGYGMPPDELDAVLKANRLEVEGVELVRAQSLPALDEPCGAYHTYRDFIACGETQDRLGISNLPVSPNTYNALHDLAVHVVNPVMDYFGGIELTYGFCSRELSKHIKFRVDPSRDQHASHEVNTRGNLICKRLGAACDFIVPDESMLEVAQWIVENTPFDRLYFYGDDKPLHVSYGPENNRAVVVMKENKVGKLTPRNTKTADFLILDLSAN